jgi:hypothetical protein
VAWKERSVSRLRTQWLGILAVGVLAGCASPRSPLDVASSRVGEWQRMFDGASMQGWLPFLDDSYAVSGGPVGVRYGELVLLTGRPYSAVTWQGTFPRENYEVALQAKKNAGDDIFCGVLFPVGTNYCSMVLGGWGNQVTGLSCVNYLVAADNDTASYGAYTTNRWYSVRLRVTEERIQAWVDEKQRINLERREKVISPYPGLDMFAPFGIFTFDTSAAFRDIDVRRLSVSPRASAARRR